MGEIEDVGEGRETWGGGYYMKEVTRKKTKNALVEWTFLQSKQRKGP